MTFFAELIVLIIGATGLTTKFRRIASVVGTFLIMYAVLAGGFTAFLVSVGVGPGSVFLLPLYVFLVFAAKSLTEMMTKHKEEEQEEEADFFERLKEKINARRDKT